MTKTVKILEIEKDLSNETILVNCHIIVLVSVQYCDAKRTKWNTLWMRCLCCIKVKVCHRQIWCQLKIGRRSNNLLLQVLCILTCYWVLHTPENWSKYDTMSLSPLLHILMWHQDSLLSQSILFKALFLFSFGAIIVKTHLQYLYCSLDTILMGSCWVWHSMFLRFTLNCQLH